MSPSLAAPCGRCWRYLRRRCRPPGSGARAPRRLPPPPWRARRRRRRRRRERQAGARVVGLLPEGAWAEHVAVPTHALAELPAKVTFSQAATYPVAGLTALHALGKRGMLLGRRG